MRIVLLLVLFTLSACTTIEISDSNGDIRIVRSFGFASISPGQGTSTITAKITNFGYVSTPLGQNIGYSNHSILLSNPDCKLVLWLSANLSQEEIMELKKLSSVCVMTED